MFWCALNITKKSSNRKKRKVKEGGLWYRDVNSPLKRLPKQELVRYCGLACLTLLFEIFSIFGFPHLEAAVLSSPIGGTEAQLATTQRSIVIATCSL